MTVRVTAAEPECDCESGVSRRTVLKAAALGGAITLGSSLVPVQAAFGAAATPTDTLVVLFLRGGADWLSMVAPLGDPNYAKARPTIGLQAAGSAALDPMFGLHPALTPLLPWWGSGQLGFVHAVGSPDPSRSHFDASAAIETGAFDGGRTLTGWLDRYLQAVPGRGAFDAVAHGSTTPQSLDGPAPSLATSGLGSFGLYNWLGSSYATALKAQFSGVTHPLGTEAHETLNAVGTAKRAFPTATAHVANGAAYPQSALGASLTDVARLIKAGLGTRVVTVDHGGWDMHTGLGQHAGVATGQMHTMATDLGASLAAFATDLGPAIGNVTLVTVTDFGRRVAENASGGLDHGHGQAMLVLGGGVRGQRVVTQWPSLAPKSLDQGDLAATTDLRSVFGTILRNRMGAGDAQVRAVFPGWAPTYLDVVAPR
jgi:uncharacterized protein (DUF1501 family)